MMLELREEWLRKVMPDGLPYPSSTLVSGPGGTGKPLVVLGFVANWLRKGGKVVGIPLQYPTMDFVEKAMKSLYGMDISEYDVTFVQFDPSIDEYKEEEHLRANLLKPDVWDHIVDNYVDKDTMLFGSALNLLLFSPTYKAAILDKIDELLKSGDKTYMFSVSTSAFYNLIERWEKSADNLMFTRMEGFGNLKFRVEKLKEGKYLKDAIDVPIPKEVLMEIKDVAEHTRKRIIPTVSKI